MAEKTAVRLRGKMGSSMRRLRSQARLTGVMLTLLGIALSGTAHAQQAGQDMVAFKTVVTSKVNAAATYVLPLEPSLASVRLDGTGESAQLGQFTAIEHTFVQHDANGQDLTTDAIGVWTFANGDAIFFTYKGLARRLEAAFVVTGGRGRFRGASGSGTMTFAPGSAAGEFICTFEGVISAPKA